MRKSFIAGKGLACALGSSVEEVISNMLTGSSRPIEVEFDCFSDVIRLPWFSIETPEPLGSTERFYRIFERVIQEAIDDAGLSEQQCSSMGLFLGSSSFNIGLSEVSFQADLEQKVENPLPLPMTCFGQLLGHLRREFGLRGRDYTYSTACSASANAVLGASRMIEAGVIDHALVIGLELYNITTLSGFYGLQLLTDDKLRPFDKNRNGIMLGEGCGAVVLSATDDVSKKITITGGASTCDTDSVTVANVDGSSIETVLNRAMQEAALKQEDISAIKVHGTASELGDKGEAAGIHRVFKTVPTAFSLKSYIGHTLGACGVNELILFAGALEQGVLPKSTGFTQEDPELKISLTLDTVAAAAEGNYLINHFGFGGNNTVLAIHDGGVANSKADRNANGSDHE